MAKKKIDIIVPAYKAQHVLHRVLGSVIIQTAVDFIKVTIVNDADENDYQDIIKPFEQFVDIQEIRMEVNGGLVLQDNMVLIEPIVLTLLV